MLRCMVLFSVWLGPIGVGEKREIESETQDESLLQDPPIEEGLQLVYQLGLQPSTCS